MRQRKRTNEEIIEAYSRTGSVWAAAKTLGMCGQSVHERLKRLGHRMSLKPWTEAEDKEIARLAPQYTITDISQQLGRTYSAVATRISVLGLGVRFGNTIRTKFAQPKPIGETAIRAHFTDLLHWDGSVRQFCRSRGIRLERFVTEVQRHMPEEWSAFAKAHSTLAPKPCPQCSTEFHPLTQKQAACSRKCAMAYRIDRDYFGGKRSTAVGITEGVCQLCGRDSGGAVIAAHHLYGRENDPEHDAMIALCSGCHQIVGTLAGNASCANPDFWEGLIAWALMRHHGKDRPIGFHVCVDIDEVTTEDVEAAE